MNKDADNSILGLYLSKQTPNLESTKAIAAILVRRDTNKWVLVHEYMHHLFHHDVQENGLSDADLKAMVQKNADELESSISQATWATGEDRKQKVQIAYKNLLGVKSGLIELMRRYKMEEMTIETILSGYHESGALTLVNKGQRLNGAAYIVDSEKTVTKLFGQLKEESQNFQIKFGADLTLAEISALKKHTETMQKYEAEMATLKSKALAYIRSQGYDMSGLRIALATLNGGTAGETHEKIGCAHGEIPQEIIDSVMRISK